MSRLDRAHRDALPEAAAWIVAGIAVAVAVIIWELGADGHRVLGGLGIAAGAVIGIFAQTQFASTKSGENAVGVACFASLCTVVAGFGHGYGGGVPGAFAALLGVVAFGAMMLAAAAIVARASGQEPYSFSKPLEK